MDAIASSQPTEEQNLAAVAQDLLVVLLRRRWTVLGVYAVVLATAVGGIFLLPPQYRAAAKILLTSDRAQVSTSPDRPTELVRTSAVGDAEVTSQTEILQSRELVESVLKEMMPPGEPPASAEGHGIARTALWVVGTPFRLLRAAYRRLHDLEAVEPSSPLYWETTEVLGHLSAARVRDSNLIEVAMVSPDPVWAREFVDRLTKAYVERHAQLQQVQEAEDFFTQQSRLLQQKLTQSEAALRQARERAGALAGQQSEIHDRLNEFSAELARTKIARAEQEQRVQFLEGLQANAGKKGRIATPQLLELEAKRAELLGRYRPDSERVREIDDQIQRLRTAIASYDTITGAGAGDATGGGDLVAARAQLAALKGKEEALQKQQDEYRKQAEMLDAQSFDVARLERQVKLDEEAYLSYVRTAEQSRLTNALEQSKILQLTVVEPATVPMEPVSPKKGRIMVFALVGGLAVSIGAAFARDRMDATIKTATDVRRYGRLEVLAALPDRT